MKSFPNSPIVWLVTVSPIVTATYGFCILPYLVNISTILITLNISTTCVLPAPYIGKSYFKEKALALTD